MKITEIAADSVSVHALIEAADAIKRLAVEHSVTLAIVDNTLVVVPVRDGFVERGGVAVTVEDPPRLVTLTPDDAPDEDEDADDNPSGPCRHSPGRTFCVCLRYCCSAQDGRCVCRDCIDGTHAHG